MAVLPFDDRQLKIEVGHADIIVNKLNKVKNAFSKVMNSQIPHLSILNNNKTTPPPNTNNPIQNKQKITTNQYLQTINYLMSTNIIWVRKQQSNKQPNKKQQQNSSQTNRRQFKQYNVNKIRTDVKMIANVYPVSQNSTVEVDLYNRTLQPFIKQYIQLSTNLSNSANTNSPIKLSNSEFISLYRNLYLLLSCLGSLQISKSNHQSIQQYTSYIYNQLMSIINQRLQAQQKEQQNKRIYGNQKITMAVPKGNVQLILCFHKVIKIIQKLNQFNQSSSLSKKQNHLSSSALTTYPLSATLLQSLPKIYQFMNKIVISNLKSLQQTDLVNTFHLIKTLQQLKVSQKQNILLLQLNPLIYEYLYQSLSVFIIYLTDRGKYYLKLFHFNVQNFFMIINLFISQKALFKSLQSKKRFVVLQAILVGLIRRKYIKITSTHLKRSQHAKLVLSFMQIFQFPQNLTTDFKKIIQQTQFLSTDLEQFSNQTLQKYTDLNWSISHYLDTNNVNLTSSKKLAKLTLQQLKKEFQQNKSSKIYQMIVRNSKYHLPFELPLPKNNDTNAKLVYIIEKIYQKISKKNNYTVPKTGKSFPSYNTGLKTSKKSTKKSIQQSVNQQSPFIHEQIKPLQQFSQDLSQQISDKFEQINLQQQKQYIKRQCLINYTYEDHYKMNSNKLPLHYKKQNWKNLYSVSKQLEIESLQIDQKIDQNIYKKLLLALLGYIQKIKFIAKQFHAHSFIQYVAAQLDMEVYYHGCITKISRKNKPQQNVVFVCAVQTNYKLLYICTHILRQSGQNAYIIMDKTKDTDFRQFLQKILPQPFQAQQSQIVDKVVKGQIGIDGQDGVIRQQDN